MAYKVISEIINTSGENFDTLEQFSAWYFDPYIEQEINRIKTANGDTAYDTLMEVTRTLEWDAERQVCVKTRIFTDINHYNKCNEFFMNAGIGKVLETVISETEI